MGPQATTADTPPEDLTLEWDPYEEDVDGTTGSPQYTDEIVVPMPEQGDNLLHVEIMLPRGGAMARGRVVDRKRYHEGNPIRRDNQNLILDSGQHEVYFDDGNFSELTANVITDNIDAKCDHEGKQYVLIE